MSDQGVTETMLDVFLFETSQNITQLEQLILSGEEASCYTESAINEIFRIMHTIKGSADMMLLREIAALAHAMEDVFYFLRESKPQDVDCSALSDLILDGVDFIKVELAKVRNGEDPDGDAATLIQRIKEFLLILKEAQPPESTTVEQEHPQKPQQGFAVGSMAVAVSGPGNFFKAVVYFEDGCEMENIRAYSILLNLQEVAREVFYLPEDIMDNDDSVQVIREHGFKLWVKTELSYEELAKLLGNTVFLRDLELVQLEDDREFAQFQHSTGTDEAGPVKGQEPLLRTREQQKPATHKTRESQGSVQQSIISVNVAKLDSLLDLVGELVIAEAMVTQNPDLQGLELNNFHKAARQLRKISSEIQDIVMSIRMVPLTTTFQKMQRVVRDMHKKLGKDVRLEIRGEETEVDKNIIEHISDPLMHLVRNAIDHGIEDNEERQALGKPLPATITLEAQNAGSDVLISVKDDGRGLNKDKILALASANGLLQKPEGEMTDKEIYGLIFLPGFSTKDEVTEFSGRGVGMDVVVKNIETLGGSVMVESAPNEGTTITLKIPLTLSIIDGMNLRVGSARYTLPITAIKESFRPLEQDLVTDPAGNEMVMVRGQCYPVIRLNRLYNVPTEVTRLSEGILIMLEQEDKTLCLFADELLGQQQVVVKALPRYVKNFKRIKGLAGCTLLGDGSISLILDASDFCRQQGA